MGFMKNGCSVLARATSAIIYNKQIGAADTADPTTAIGGGSIVIQAK
jgi:hypothetical protein